MHEWQWIINIGIGSILAVLGWFARQLWDSVQKLNIDLNKLEIHLPTKYVAKDDFIHYIDVTLMTTNEQFKELKALLSKIADKLDSKADK